MNPLSLMISILPNEICGLKFLAMRNVLNIYTGIRKCSIFNKK